MKSNASFMPWSEQSLQIQQIQLWKGFPNPIQLLLLLLLPARALIPAAAGATGGIITSL